MKIARCALVLLALCLAALPARAGWQNLMKSVGDSLGDNLGNKAAQSAGLSSQDIAAGLKQALEKAVDAAVSGLGRLDGYLGNPEVRIPLPDKLRSAESLVRKVGHGDTADAFIASMNRAAEQAAPQARDVFLKALGAMTLQDARAILEGPEDAATRYFETTTRDELAERFLPLVAKATDSVGVTRSYKAMMDRAGPVARLSGLGEADLDGYVTDKGLDGLFVVMAQEEKDIRTNPVARTTDLLKKVFGSTN